MTHPTHHTKLQSDMTGNTNMTVDGDEMGGHTGAIRGVADTIDLFYGGGVALGQIVPLDCVASGATQTPTKTCASLMVAVKWML